MRAIVSTQFWKKVAHLDDCYRQVVYLLDDGTHATVGTLLVWIPTPEWELANEIAGDAFEGKLAEVNFPKPKY